MCHLSVEKALKAIVLDRKKKPAPKTHDLLRLIELGEIRVPEKHRPILAHLNEASVPTRYPEDVSKLVRHYNRSAAQRYLKETKSLLQWLRTLVK
jgi:HEPN domain-containing protein